MDIKVLFETVRLSILNGDLIGASKGMVGAAVFMEEAHDGMPDHVRVASEVCMSNIRQTASEIAAGPHAAYHKFRHLCVQYTHGVLLPWLKEEGLQVKTRVGSA